MLTAAELASLRDAADDWLPDTCTIQTPTEAVDATGGVTLTWADTYEDVPVRVDPAALGGVAAETIRNFALESKAVFNASLKYTQDIAPDYRLVFAGDTYEVVTVHSENSWVTLNIAMIVRLD